MPEGKITREMAIAETLRALKACFPDRWEEIITALAVLPPKRATPKDRAPRPQHHDPHCAINYGSMNCNCDVRKRQVSASGQGHAEKVASDALNPDVSK